MNIIPHNPINVQVGISKKTDQIQTFSQIDYIKTYGLSPTQRAAYLLYDAGFNVLPQPIASKGGLPWQRLQYERLSRDDENYGIRHLFAGNCNLAIMCGTTSRNLFVIDCESIDIYLYHIQQMHDRGIPIWAVRTARGGHIYLRAKNGEVHNIESGIMTDVEIKGRNGYVLAPPSIHPSGIRYKWDIQQGDHPPVVHTDQIDWLYTRDHQKITLTTDDTSTRKRGNWQSLLISPASNLSRATRDYLQNGGQLPEGTRNNALFGAACDLCGNDYSHSEAESLLIPIATMSGLPLPEVKATIRSAYCRARTPSCPSKKMQRQVWRYALIWGMQHQWQGRTASSDRALFLALIERARVSSNENDVFRASIRELSQLARLGTTTIRNGLARLQEVGIIQKCGVDRTSQATLWRFRDEIISDTKTSELNMDTIGIAPHWLRYSESIFNSDVVERGGLGHAVTFIYQFLGTLTKPMMPRDIAQALGLSVNQINYALKKLSEAELVFRLDMGWYPVKLTLPELEAMFEEVAGKGDARVARYRHERQVFAGYILFNARVRQEKQHYIRAVSHQFALKREAQAILDDPLIQLGFELGGVLRE